MINREELEKIVDRHGMSRVIEELAQIASEKAEHIETNWQDKPLAKTWNNIMMVLDNTAWKVRKLGERA